MVTLSADFSAPADGTRLWAGRTADSFYIDLSLLAIVNAAVASETAPNLSVWRPEGAQNSFAGTFVHSIVLEVGIGLRWPFAGLRRDVVAQRLPDDLHPALRAKLGKDAGDIGLDGTS